MLLEPPLAKRVCALNNMFAPYDALGVLEKVLIEDVCGKTTLVSSFGTDSVVLLHMVSLIKPDACVLFVDTLMLFSETLEYQLELTEHLGLTNVQRIMPDSDDLGRHDPDSQLHDVDSETCCRVRKVLPLTRALEGFDSWITGRKRYQTKKRSSLKLFENEADHRIKINPLAHWKPEDVRDYIHKHSLPEHPLILKGFSSLGCVPCTSATGAGSAPRNGRWPGKDKEECGIHFINGKLVRTHHSMESHT